MKVSKRFAEKLTANILLENEKWDKQHNRVDVKAKLSPKSNRGFIWD